jgi:hypothetical protein
METNKRTDPFEEAKETLIDGAKAASKLFPTGAVEVVKDIAFRESRRIIQKVFRR